MFVTVIAIILEGIMAVPIIGGALVLSTGWALLWVAGLIHLAGGIVGRARVGHIVGLFASLFGWIPFIGFILHLSAFILLLIDVRIKKV